MRDREKGMVPRLLGRERRRTRGREALVDIMELVYDYFVFLSIFIICSSGIVVNRGMSNSYVC
jgi:hypothetical protein